MLRHVIVAALLVFTGSMHAQQTVRGTVSDEEGKPLPGANIFLRNSLQGTITGTDGSFKLTRAHAHPDSLVVTFMGYRNEVVALGSSEETEIDITMEPRQFLADEVLIIGSRAGNRTPTAYTNIDEEELQRNNTGNAITYMLSNTPSVVATSEAGIGIGNTAIRIRGSNPNRINVTINGIPLNDAESQDVFWVNMPDFGSSVDNVQIQRGVGTSTQGSAAFGATINFQTGDYEEKPYATYSFLGGAFNTFRHMLEAGSGLIGNRFTFDTRLSKLDSDGYVDYSFSDHASLYLTGAYHAKNSLLRFTFIDGKQKTGISWWGVPPEIADTNRTYNPAGVYFDSEGNEQYYENQTDNYRQTHYQLHFAHSMSPHLKLNAAAHYTRGKGYYEQYKDDENFVEYGLDTLFQDFDTITVSDLARQKWLENDFFGFVTSAHYRKANYEITIGGGWNKYIGDHFGNIIWMEANPNVPANYRWYYNLGTKTDWNVFAKASYMFTPEATLFGDLQYRRIGYDMSGTDDDLLPLEQTHTYDFFNPKAGIFYNYNSQHRGYFSLAIAHREPTRANFKEAKGDPASTPQPERLYDLELGYTFTLDKVLLGANLYYMHYKDQLVPTGEKSAVGYDIMTNVDRSFRRGVELESVYRPFRMLEWRANLTLSQNKIIGYVEYTTYYGEETEVRSQSLGNTTIAYSPSVVGSSVIDYEFLPGAHAVLISKYVGRQYFDNTSSDDRTIDPYFLTDLRFEYSLGYKFVKELSLFVQINNLFDTKYFNNAYGGYYYVDGEQINWAYIYPQAGIHVFSGVKIRF